MIEDDDILFVDLGPVFEAWGTDIGRTFVLGDNAGKKRIRDALQPLWSKVKTYFEKNKDITGERLYEFAKKQAEELGYNFGAHAGHLIGDFPYERIPKAKITFYITIGNDKPLRSLDKDGKERHWILEIHLIDKENQIGRFFKQLLTADQDVVSECIAGISLRTRLVTVRRGRISIDAMFCFIVLLGIYLCAYLTLLQ